jgi:hypothetical protein
MSPDERLTSRTFTGRSRAGASSAGSTASPTSDSRPLVSPPVAPAIDVFARDPRHRRAQSRGGSALPPSSSPQRTCRGNGLKRRADARTRTGDPFITRQVRPDRAYLRVPLCPGTMRRRTRRRWTEGHAEVLPGTDGCCPDVAQHRRLKRQRMNWHDTVEVVQFCPRCQVCEDCSPDRRSESRIKSGSQRLVRFGGRSADGFYRATSCRGSSRALSFAC